MSPTQNTRARALQARLLARPSPTALEDAPTGLLPLHLGGSRDGALYVPPNYRPDRPSPLVLMLHGAGSNGQVGLAPFLPVADMAGLLLLAPDSRQPTWDVIVGNYGPDVTFIDKALAHVFSRYAVDTSHLVIAGFSDGASYALSLGLANGDLFTHIIAFSPGFIAPGGRQGRPHIYISHGTQDTVLPIELCSRQIVRQLQREHYDVFYREFDGPHTVPLQVVREALEWLYHSA